MKSVGFVSLDSYFFPAPLMLNEAGSEIKGTEQFVTKQTEILGKFWGADEVSPYNYS